VSGGAPALGLIAGSGPLPLIAAREAKTRGLRVVAVALREETDPALEGVADRTGWIRVGQLGALLRTFRREGVTEAIMVGKVQMTHLFGRVRPDLRGARLFARLRDRRGDAILEGVAEELAKEGITLRRCTDFLGGILLAPGVLTRRAPTASEREDIRIGREIARTIAALKIGQTVVVKRGTVVAVESIEGTDAAIRRGGALGKDGVVVVKASRSDHDFRFDVPVIGRSTVEVLREVRGRVLAVEAGRTLCPDREEMVALADEGGITIIAE